MSTTRITEPTQFTQGERLAWTKTLADYPASEWTLKYYFRTAAGPGFNVTATASGDDHLAEVAASVTSGVGTGRIDWQAWVTEIADTDNVQQIESGYATVKLGFDPAKTAKVDLRTPAKIALDSIDAAMEAFATSDIQEYEISTPSGSRRVKRSARADLLSLRKYYGGRVALEEAAERARTTGKFGRSVNVRVFDNG